MVIFYDDTGPWNIRVETSDVLIAACYWSRARNIEITRLLPRARASIHERWKCFIHPFHVKTVADAINDSIKRITLSRH